MQLEHPGGRLRWLAPAALICLVALLAPVAGQVRPASASANWGLASSKWTRSPLRVQADLLRSVIAHPAAQVRVIVQGQPGTANLAAQVTRLGGHVTKNLSLIHAVAATVPGRVVRQLGAVPDVRWVSVDGAVIKSGYACCSASTLQDVYPQSSGATQVWNRYQGKGIGVAVVDSGIGGSGGNNTVADVSNLVASVNVNPAYHHHTTDLYGHGTSIAGIIAGNGTNSNGAYVGIAPQANVLNVRIADDNGMATVSDVVNGLQWVFDNQSAYNIRVVNLSLNSTVADSYQVDPLDAAVEALWDAGIAVVVSAGNSGSTNAGVLFAPANDPFVITVGAVNDQGTASTGDDTLASFSSYGSVPVSTTAGLTIPMNKPDLVASGMNIVSILSYSGDTLAQAHPANVVTSASGCVCYFRMSGTSMAAPIVAGAAVLLLQSNPSLTPNQVKNRLISTAQPVATSTGVGAGEVNVAAAVASTSTTSANKNLAMAASLQPGNPAALWTSASWGSASWGSASWGSASWGSASWGSASWGSASWGSASWGSDYWGS